MIRDEFRGLQPDGLLLQGGEQTSGLVADVLDAGSDDCPAVHALQQAPVAKIIDVFADGLRGNGEAFGQDFDLDPTPLPGHHKDFLLPF